MTVATTRYHGAVIVTVVGEVDMSTADSCASVIAALDGPNTGPVIIDLRAVTFFASTGLSALLDVRERAIRRTEPLRLVVDHVRPVVRPLEIAGMDKLLALFDDLAEALSRT
jgi:anti-sigma B factor antagonist